MSTTDGTGTTPPLLAFIRGHLPAYLIVGSTFLLSYWSALITRPQYIPDARYYLAMSLWYGGASQQDAAARVQAHSLKFGFPAPGVDQLFGWGLVQPRVVMPALSAPFVKLWGPDALAVVPGIAFALFVLVVLTLLIRRYGSVAAVGAMLLFLASSRMAYFSSMAGTESLVALFVAITLILGWRYVRSPSRPLLAAIVLVTVITAFTRQSTLIPAGAFFMAWLGSAIIHRKPAVWRAPAIATVFTAVSVQLLQSAMFPSFSQANQFMAKTGTDSLMGAILASPRLALRIWQTDVRSAQAVDTALMVLLFVSLVSMLVLWRHTESHLLLGALLAYEVYSVTNGTPTLFRYGMPGLVFVLSSVALLLARMSGPGLVRRSVARTEPGWQQETGQDSRTRPRHTSRSWRPASGRRRSPDRSPGSRQ